MAYNTLCDLVLLSTQTSSHFLSIGVSEVILAWSTQLTPWILAPVVSVAFTDFDIDGVHLFLSFKTQI